MELSPLMLLIGFFLPALIGFVNKSILNADARFWISFIICSFIGGVVNYIEHNGIYTGLTMLEIANTFASSALLMTGLVKLSYEAVWGNTRMTDEGSILKKLELKAPNSE